MYIILTLLYYNTLIVFDEFERNLWAYRLATALQPGPPQNPSPFSGKRGPMFVMRFCYILPKLYTHFQKFSPRFFTWIFTNLTHVWGFFLGGSKWDPCLQIYCVKFLYIIHLWSSSLVLYFPKDMKVCRNWPLWKHLGPSPGVLSYYTYRVILEESNWKQYRL